ncbi:MAG: diacylglycerol kinase family protein [Clostridia bacterium]|nr:diacylglycerol kinase family protein [Clostridia bacterium]
MKKTYILYNPVSGNNIGKEGTDKLCELYSDKAFELKNICEITDYREFFASISAEDDIILCGGDGTLNVFVNNTQGIEYDNDLLFYGMGTGNDFLRDIGKEKGAEPFSIKKYTVALPTVTVNGKSYKFLNNVGFGIDGYCCEVGDKLRAENKKNINYTTIAIKGLLFSYRPTNAAVVVDGKEYSYKKVWIAPTMNGRYYGGGMMPTPEQDRLNKERTVSLMLLYGSGKLKTLMAFPSLFKGEMLAHTDMTKVHVGKEITVKFDRPAAIQIDGETITGVTEYSVRSAACDTSGARSSASACAD